MAFNGSGVYSLAAGNPVVTGTTISSTWANNTLNDIATAMTLAVCKDGQSTPTANLPMGTFKHTNVADAVARNQYASAGQTQDAKLNWVAGAGTADAITCTYSPALTALVDGQLCYVRATAANATTTPTFAPNALAAHTIVKGSGAALVVGDIPGVNYEMELRYDLTNTRWTLLNPYTATTATTATNLAGGSAGKITYQSAAGTTGFIALGQIQPLPTPTLAANALTIPSATYTLDFRNATLGTGDAPTTISGAIAAAIIPSGATLGTINAVQSDIYVLAINNAGTMEYAFSNASGGVDLSEAGVISTTALSAGSTSATVVYSTTARTNVAYRVIGLIRSTQATAGTWVTSPSLVQGAGGQALTAMSSIGYGQSWQINGAGITRVAGTTYYNTTGKPIWVKTYVGSPGGGLSVNGIAAGISATTIWQDVLVPAGASYILTAGAVINNWNELR